MRIPLGWLSDITMVVAGGHEVTNSGTSRQPMGFRIASHISAYACNETAVGDPVELRNSPLINSHVG